MTGFVALVKGGGEAADKLRETAESIGLTSEKLGSAIRGAAIECRGRSIYQVACPSHTGHGRPNQEGLGARQIILSFVAKSDVVKLTFLPTPKPFKSSPIPIATARTHSRDLEFRSRSQTARLRMSLRFERRLPTNSMEWRMGLRRRVWLLSCSALVMCEWSRSSMGDQKQSRSWKNRGNGWPPLLPRRKNKQSTKWATPSITWARRPGARAKPSPLCLRRRCKRSRRASRRPLFATARPCWRSRIHRGQG